jgi:hypothetical protein
MFCNNCRNKIDINTNFCSNCGQKIIVPNSNINSKNRKYIFSSNILVGGNILTPDRIIIDDYGVTYERRNSYLIGTDRSFLSFSNISYVRIDRKLISSEIIISSKGSSSIIAKDFFISDARKIEQIIKSKLMI